jgi:hypothetical protein
MLQISVTHSPDETAKRGYRRQTPALHLAVLEKAERRTVIKDDATAKRPALRSFLRTTTSPDRPHYQQDRAPVPRGPEGGIKYLSRQMQTVVSSDIYPPWTRRYLSNFPPRLGGLVPDSRSFQSQNQAERVGPNTRPIGSDEPASGPLTGCFSGLHMLWWPLGELQLTFKST